MRVFKSALLAAAGMVTAMAFAGTASAADHKVPEPLFPVSQLLADKSAELVYPSVAGDFLVYSQRKGVADYSVMQVSARSLQAGGTEIKPTTLNEKIKRLGIQL